MGGQFPGGPGMGGINGSAMNAVGGGGAGNRTSAGGGGGQAVAPAGGDAGATRYNIMPAGTSVGKQVCPRMRGIGTSAHVCLVSAVTRSRGECRPGADI
jgi:hypothetical protein